MEIRAEANVVLERVVKAGAILIEYIYQKSGLVKKLKCY